MAETTYRLRVTYGKTGRLRYLSHLEVARACERAIRRAGLPYAVTEGFTQRMKVAFGPALPVGTAGLAESLDVWLTRFVPPGEALSRLAASTPEGIAPTGAVYVSASAPSLGAALTVADYEVEVRGEQVTGDEMRRAIAAVVATGEIRVQHKGKEKVFDLAACLPKEPVVEDRPGGAAVSMTIRMGEWGSLRPESLVNAALERLSATATLSTVRCDLSG